MRSSRSATDPLDPGPKGFAHRGLHSGEDAPENSRAAFAAALEFGAGIECDLRLTADDEILVFHDADANRLCGSPLRIGGSTADELSQLRLGGQPISTLAELLQLVAGRTPLLLEIKVDADLWRWTRALLPHLQSYAGPVGVMSFDPRLIALLRSAVPEIRRGLVVGAALPVWRRWAALPIASPHFVAVETYALGSAWVRRLRRRLPVYSWTVRTAVQRRRLAVHADALIWEGNGGP